jgi:geranylgeranyl pyrophosphate synthase
MGAAYYKTMGLRIMKDAVLNSSITDAPSIDTVQDPVQAMPEAITDLIATLDLSIASQHPVPEIGPLLERTVLAGGKRLRPTLCYLMSGIFEVPLEKATPYARLTEFVHSASLAHDDVLDWADRRRDKPTINAVSCNSQAILSGDFLVARVFAELSALKAYDLIGDLSEVMEFLVYGEWLQENSRYNTAVTSKTLLQVAEFKTASLISWSCMVPARMRKMDPKVVQMCKELGKKLGIGFQLVDDVIDYDPDGEKDFARDLKNGFINMVTWELIDRNPELVPELRKFLSGEAVPTPEWHREEVEAATSRVRKRASDELTAARDQLDEICRVVLGERRETNLFARSLIELIDLMAMRTF